MNLQRLIATVFALAFAAFAFADDSSTTTNDTPETKESKPTMQYVHMKTSKGDIYLELNAEKAPISVENFMSYVADEHYDGTIFHRVIPNFMIQGGGFTEQMQQKPTKAPIKNEWENGLKNTRGTIAMARTNVPDSATSQFFINVTDNDFLDQPRGGAAYAVFGRVFAGMDVVNAIREVPTTNRQGHSDVPQEPVVIEQMRKISKEDAEKAREAEKQEAEQNS
jgi:peptidyl-prolyl cis-trans isomerase A (cyclophilin A)